MYSINFKSKTNKRDLNQVKIEMIFYRPGYARVPKVTNIVGTAKDWDEQSHYWKQAKHEDVLDDMSRMF